MKEHFGYTEPFRRFVQHETFSPQANEIPNTAASWLPGDDYYVNFHEGDPFIKVDEGYARLPGEGYAALHPELKDVNPEDYPDIHKLAILADVAPYSREYNTYRQKIGRQAQGSTELEIEYEKILARVKKTRESVIRMTDRHYTEPVDEISGTVESASPGGITLKGRCLRPAENTTPRAPAPEAPCLRSHAHRQPGQQLHESRAGQLSMTPLSSLVHYNLIELPGMGSLSMACDPVVIDGVKITVELMGLHLHLYMVTSEGWRLRGVGGFSIGNDDEIHGAGRGLMLVQTGSRSMALSFPPPRPVAGPPATPVHTVALDH